MLVALSFAYGIFHAAGPGHGKAVISGYLVADSRRSLLRGLGLALASSLLQALTAIAVVGVLAALFNATTGTISAAARMGEQISFALVALLGSIMLWRKAGRFAAFFQKLLPIQNTTTATLSAPLSRLAFRPVEIVASGQFRADKVHADNASRDHHPESCSNDGCTHLLMPDALGSLSSMREMAMVALSAGLRPCTGAIIVLVFALTQGLLTAGIAAVFAMALGTFITVGALAGLAVFAKRFATKAAGINSYTGAYALAGIEVLASAFIVVIGLTLVLG